LPISVELVVKEVFSARDAGAGEDGANGAEGRVGGSEESDDVWPIGDIGFAKEETPGVGLGACSHLTDDCILG